MDIRANVQFRASRPTVQEILASPIYPDTIWNLTPTKKGLLPVAANRGGPINIEWEVHGHGDIKLVVRFQFIGLGHMSPP